MRDSFVFYRSYFEAISELDDATRLQIFDAIADYSLNKNEPKLTGISKMAFALIKPNIDANQRKYENGKKGAEHGKKGGRPCKEKTPKKPLENPKGVICENPKKTPYVDVDVDVDVDVNENVNEDLNPPTPLIEEPSLRQNDDDDDFLEKAKERFKPKERQLTEAEILDKERTRTETEFNRLEAKRILGLAKEDMAHMIDVTSPAIHNPIEFYEMLKMHYTSKEIGEVIEKLVEKQAESGKQIAIKSWAYVKSAVMNHYKN